MDHLVVPAPLRARADLTGDRPNGQRRQRLPQVVAELCTRWQVTVHEVRPTTRTFVATVVDGAGRRRALAMRETSDGWELALEAFDEAGIGPGLLAAAPAHHAVLTGWRPASRLSRCTVTLEHTRALTRALCRVNGVPAPAHVPVAYVTIADAVRQALSRLEQAGAPFAGVLLEDDAVLLAERLRPAGGLLHGHLVPGRVLQTGEALIVLEPEPTAGPVEVDLAHWCWAAASRAVPLAAHVTAVRAAAPWVDRHLLGRMLTCWARLRVVDMQAQGRHPPAALVGLARHAEP